MAFNINKLHHTKALESAFLRIYTSQPYTHNSSIYILGVFAPWREYFFYFRVSGLGYRRSLLNSRKLLKNIDDIFDSDSIIAIHVDAIRYAGSTNLRGETGD